MSFLPDYSKSSYLSNRVVFGPLLPSSINCFFTVRGNVNDMRIVTRHSYNKR